MLNALFKIIRTFARLLALGLLFRSLQIYKVDIPALGPGDRLAVTISTAYVDSLTPYPAVVGQADEQLLLYTTYKYVPTLYKTLKQKTKIKYCNWRAYS